MAFVRKTCLLPLAVVALAGAGTWGCAARGPASYRLFGADEQRVLIPPGVKDAAVKQRAFDFRTTADPRLCIGAEGGIDLTARRNGLRLTVDGGILEQQSPGWLSSWAARLEERGCIASGEGFGLAALAAHSVPLPLHVEQRLLIHDARESGFTDLRPGYRLRVVSPVFQENAAPDATAAGEVKSVEATPGGLTIVMEKSPDLVGYEMAWYAVEPRPRDAGSRIVPRYADFHHDGEVTRQQAHRVNHLPFDPSMAYFRMLFMSRRTESSDHDIFLVAAPTLPLLEERTRLVEAVPASCGPGVGEAGSPGASSTPAQEPVPDTALVRSEIVLRTECIVAPRQVGMVVFFPVQVQGKEVLLHPGATLGSALREAGADPEQALATLDVRKPYSGRLALVEALSSKRDLLALPLGGGEEIDW
jgi:hypothetical protein